MSEPVTEAEIQAYIEKKEKYKQYQKEYKLKNRERLLIQDRERSKRWREKRKAREEEILKAIQSQKSLSN